MLSVGFAGTERHAIELANALARRCEVALLLRRRPRAPHRQTAYTAMRSAVDPGVRVFHAPRAVPAAGLAQAVLRFRPDIIHAHQDRTARIASRWHFGVPVLATIHMHYRAREFGRCGGLICLTHTEAAAVPADYRGQTFVIGNWVHDHPRPAPDRIIALRAGLGLAPQDYVIGTVARLEPIKGVDGLLDAFARAAIANARLVIIGHGGDRAALERRAASLGIADRTVFAGFRPDVRDLYSILDLFVLNSNDDPYPLAILEAGAAGLPVIATETMGARAIGALMPLRLVPIGAPAELAAALSEAAVQAVRPAPVSGFRIEDRLTEILAAYRDMITPSRAGLASALLRA